MLLYLLVVKGQNLVPNPSFEDTVSCPDNLNEVDRANGWFSSGPTPDYFNSCAPSGGTFSVSVPSNFWGYQYPATGNAYVGMATASLTGFVRESIGTELLTPLQVGTQYYISFSVNLHNALGNAIAANKMGIFFSTVKYTDTGLQIPILNQSHFYTDSIFSDTLSWWLVNGSFIADSNFLFAYIGNFFDSAHTSVQQLNGTGGLAYYYVDNLCISTDSLYCNVWTSLGNSSIEKKPELFPNPLHDSFYIKNLSEKIHNVRLYDAAGKLFPIIIENFSDKLKLSLSNGPPGIYLLEIITQNNIFHFKIIRRIN